MNTSLDMTFTLTFEVTMSDLLENLSRLSCMDCDLTTLNIDDLSSDDREKVIGLLVMYMDVYKVYIKEKPQWEKYFRTIIKQRSYNKYTSIVKKSINFFWKQIEDNSEYQALLDDMRYDPDAYNAAMELFVPKNMGLFARPNTIMVDFIDLHEHDYRFENINVPPGFLLYITPEEIDQCSIADFTTYMKLRMEEWRLVRKMTTIMNCIWTLTRRWKYGCCLEFRVSYDDLFEKLNDLDLMDVTSLRGQTTTVPFSPV